MGDNLDSSLYMLYLEPVRNNAIVFYALHITEDAFNHAVCSLSHHLLTAATITNAVTVMIDSY